MDVLVCRSCHREYSLAEPRWKCECGGLLDLAFTPVFDLDAIRSRPPDMWRYREALPLVDDAAAVSFGEGFTPLVPVDFNGRSVWMKLDHLAPTGSYKDRGAAMLISKAYEVGVQAVVEDSSGNAGCAIAAYCAKAGIACDIYVPADTSPGKLAQIEMYGARLIKTPGSREDTARAVWSAAQDTYYASHSWNPFFFHGTKTWAFEVCEQLGWRAPNTVILPAGNGTLFLGAYIGFRELLAAGVIAEMPRMMAVQAENCAPLAAAFHNHDSAAQPFVKHDTLAEGIAIAEPVRGPQIMTAVRETTGDFISVSETEIKASLIAMCRQGYYIEPTSAATSAAVARYTQSAPQDEVIVSVFTGHGLKSTEKMLKILHE